MMFSMRSHTCLSLKWFISYAAAYGGSVATLIGVWLGFSDDIASKVNGLLSGITYQVRRKTVDVSVGKGLVKSRTAATGALPGHLRRMGIGG